MKKIISAMAVVALITGCNNNKYEFEANFPTKFEGKTAIVANYDDSLALDSAKIENGRFIKTGETDSPKLVQIMIEGRTRAYAIIEPGKITLSDSTYIASGTPLNDQFKSVVAQIDSVGELDDMALYLDFIEKQYNAFKEGPTSYYFATELTRFSELPTIDSLLNLAPQHIKDSKRVERYRNSAQLRSATMPGKMFIDFQATQPDGSIMRLSDVVGKGNFVLVDFWASWCPYCIKEFPALAEINAKYADKGFKILGVAVRDKAEDTKASADKHAITWDIMYNAERTPYNIYGFTGIPHLMLIGPDGTIISRGQTPKQIDAYLQEVYNNKSELTK